MYMMMANLHRNDFIHLQVTYSFMQHFETFSFVFIIRKCCWNAYIHKCAFSALIHC